MVVKEEEDALVAPPASPMSAAMAEAEAPKGISPELQVHTDRFVAVQKPVILAGSYRCECLVEKIAWFMKRNLACFSVSSTTSTTSWPWRLG